MGQDFLDIAVLSLDGNELYGEIGILTSQRHSVKYTAVSNSEKKKRHIYFLHTCAMYSKLLKKNSKFISLLIPLETIS